MNEYIIINKTELLKRIEGLEDSVKDELSTLEIATYKYTISELKEILSKSTPLIPEIEKAWNSAYNDALYIDEDTYDPLFLKDYISNLKLHI